MFQEKIFQKKNILLVIFLTLYALCVAQQTDAAWYSKKKVTIICYMNGDNNLAGEVLHAVDMMETVGSSDEVEIIALVDGRPGDNGGYGPQWEKTKILHITKDDEIGIIHSRVIEDMGEKNLGDPIVLEKFIKRCLKYPSEKYIFILFAHGRGIIDTKSLTNQKEKNYKSVLLSPDETGQRAMSHQEFKLAVKNGLSGEKFHLMLFFSCLTNMVEVGYGLRDMTRYMIGSEDEIRIVNEPPGTFQIRGIEPEKLIGTIVANQNVPALELGKVTIDSFISQYAAGNNIHNEKQKKKARKLPASLALVDCSKYNKLSESLDILANHLVDLLRHETLGKEVLTGLHAAITVSQNYPSFLNLEYVDLQNILENLTEYSRDRLTKELCQNSIDILKNELILYERHTDDSQSNGVSIFLPSFLVPENIYLTHRRMYEEASFSKDTSWGKLIDLYRAQMLERNTEILVDEYEKAFFSSDIEVLERLNSKISWALRKDILNGKYISTQRYLGILGKMDATSLPSRFLLTLQDALQTRDKHHQVNADLRETVEVLLISTENNIPNV